MVIHTMAIFKLVVLGAITGLFSGFFGVGGGVFLVPSLVFFYGMKQHMAQGTSLAVLLLPIGLPGVIAYYREGHVDFRIAAYVVLGFLLGITVGSSLVSQISGPILKKCFGVFMLGVSLQMIFAP